VTATDNAGDTITRSYTLTIGQATPTVSVSVAGGIYNGSPFTATATVTGVDNVARSSLEGVSPTLDYRQMDGQGNLIADLGATAPTDAGSYTVTASFASSADYASASALAKFTIGKANATVTVTPYSGTYDTQAHTASVVITGVGGSSDILAQKSATRTNAG